MKLIFAFAFLIPALALAQGTTPPRAGLTPESPFYFLDRLGETVREFLTLNPESKARLHVVFAAERVAEIKVILETKGVEAPRLTIAQERLKRNIERATAIVKEEKERGNDVSALAGEIVDDFHLQREAAKQAFEDAKQEFSMKKKELRDRLNAAKETGDTALQEQIRSELVAIEIVKDEAEAKKEATIADLESEKERLHGDLEEKKRQEEEAREALDRERERMEEAAEQALEREDAEEDIEDELLKQEIEKSAERFGEDAEDGERDARDIEEND